MESFKVSVFPDIHGQHRASWCQYCASHLPSNLLNRSVELSSITVYSCQRTCRLRSLPMGLRMYHAKHGVHEVTYRVRAFNLFHVRSSGATDWSESNMHSLVRGTRIAVIFGDAIVLFFSWRKTMSIRKEASSAHIKVKLTTLLIRDGAHLCQRSLTFHSFLICLFRYIILLVSRLLAYA